MVRQKVYSTFVIPTTATSPGPYFIAKQFTLSDIPQALSFRQLYDEYKINAVSTKIILNSNTNTGSNQNLQLGFVTNDKDSSAIPGSWSTFLERAGTKIRNLYPGMPNGCSASMYVKPTPLTVLYETNVSSGYALMKKAPFVDMGDPAVPHYGLLYGFNNGQEERNNTCEVTVCTTYYLSFRGLK